MKTRSIKNLAAQLMMGIAMIGFTTMVNAQTTIKKTDDTKKEMKMNKTPLKDHVCTAACEKAGHHVYAHGEKGHVCTAACKSHSMKMKDGKMMKDAKMCSQNCKKDSMMMKKSSTHHHKMAAKDKTMKK